jgi:hypothetical protein
MAELEKAMSKYVPPHQRTGSGWGLFFAGIFVGMIIGGASGYFGHGAINPNTNKSIQVTEKKNEDKDSAKNRSLFEDPPTIPEALSAHNPSRSSPNHADLKDVAAFPEEKAGKSLVFEDVWIDGEIERVADTKYMSPSVSTKDGKMVIGVRSVPFSSAMVFVMPESIGRRVNVTSRSDSKYSCNIYCDIIQRKKITFAMIYKIEFQNRKGIVIETIE